MAEEEIRLPKTSCVLRNDQIVACDDYLKSKDGKAIKDYTCCKTCGWNKLVADRRLKKIYAERKTLRVGA